MIADLPSEILIAIFILLLEPYAWSLTCRHFHVISKDASARVSWLMRSYGKSLILPMSILVHPSILNANVAKELISRHVPIPRVLIQLTLQELTKSHNLLGRSHIRPSVLGLLTSEAARRYGDDRGFYGDDTVEFNRRFKELCERPQLDIFLFEFESFVRRTGFALIPFINWGVSEAENAWSLYEHIWSMALQAPQALDILVDVGQMDFDRSVNVLEKTGVSTDWILRMLFYRHCWVQIPQTVDRSEEAIITAIETLRRHIPSMRITKEAVIGWGDMLKFQESLQFGDPEIFPTPALKSIVKRLLENNCGKLVLSHQSNCSTNTHHRRSAIISSQYLKEQFITQ